MPRVCLNPPATNPTLAHIHSFLQPTFFTTLPSSTSIWSGILRKIILSTRNDER